MTVRKPGLVVTRRQALLGAGALAAPYIAKAAEPIRIGLLLAKTGQIAPQTEYLAQGTYLALEERGNKIMGQPAELVWLDEPSPQGATQNMQKLVQENKVCAILGGSLSSNALAEEATAAQLKIPFVCDNAAAETCPVWPGQPMTAHWGIPDPALATGTEAEVRLAFADALRMLTNRIAIFVSLPLRARSIEPAETAQRDRHGQG